MEVGRRIARPPAPGKLLPASGGGLFPCVGRHPVLACRALPQRPRLVRQGPELGVQLGLGATWHEWRCGVAVLQEEVSREEEPELRRGWGVDGDMGGEVEGLSTGGEVI